MFHFKTLEEQKKWKRIAIGPLSSLNLWLIQCVSEWVSEPKLFFYYWISTWILCVNLFFSSSNWIYHIALFFFLLIRLWQHTFYYYTIINFVNYFVLHRKWYRFMKGHTHTHAFAQLIREWFRRRRKNEYQLAAIFYWYFWNLSHIWLSNFISNIFLFWLRITHFCAFCFSHFFHKRFKCGNYSLIGIWTEKKIYEILKYEFIKVTFW